MVMMVVVVEVMMMEVMVRGGGATTGRGFGDRVPIAVERAIIILLLCIHCCVMVSCVVVSIFVCLSDIFWGCRYFLGVDIFLVSNSFWCRIVFGVRTSSSSSSTVPSRSSDDALPLPRVSVTSVPLKGRVGSDRIETYV